MQGFTFSRSGFLYKFLTFVSVSDRYNVHDTCALVRRLIWVSCKILLISAVIAYLTFSCVHASIVTAIGLMHGLSFNESIHMVHPAFVVPLMVLIVLPCTVLVILAAAGVTWLYSRMREKTAVTFKQALHQAAENSDLGKVLVSRAQRICVSVEFKD